MTPEHIRAASEALWGEIARRPADRPALRAELRALLAEFGAQGLPLPANMDRLEAALAEDEPENGFDNMPV